MSDGEELYKKYRPTKLSEVIGQKEAISALTDMGKRGAIPHTLLFTGPSGTGKTTLARLRLKLQCSDMDFNEINAASSRGIDMVRDVSTHVGSSPIGGKCRVWMIDESHALTTDAQDAFLKLLEDTPKHVYFFLCTTNPQKMKKTILTRCTEIVCKPVSVKDLSELVLRVVKAESAEIEADVVAAIAEAADGSPRKALVILHQVIGIKDHSEQLRAVEAADVKAVAFAIAQKLMRKDTKWNTIAEILANVEEDPESIRYMVLGYARTVLLKSGDARAALIMEHFVDNFYDSKAAGLALACYNVIQG